MDIQVYELSCVMPIDRNRSLLLVSCFIFKKSMASFRVNLSLKILSVLQIFLLELTSRILWSYLGKLLFRHSLLLPDGEPTCYTLQWNLDITNFYLIRGT